MDEHTLGRFGDRRLDKGGRRFSGAWLRVLRSAFAGWAAGIGEAKFGLAAFWPTRR